ncbi:uncharacterized protein LOC127901738 [Citrus sinensis]|uniref:uncharacterized protein LOC127901738 n=1 Tax=Citrus sinensis TaxID=2711 RepID=UPI002277A801|nr:uncharacterized protein LOC127901738 [Citrus sinensis]
MKSAEKHFNQLLENERILKFNEEALEFKLNDTGLLENETTTMHQVNHQFTDTQVVVTILLALKGSFFGFLILNVYSQRDVKWALRVFDFLCSWPFVQIRGIKVLWIPRQENEILSYQELQKQYPRLQAFEN